MILKSLFAAVAACVLAVAAHAQDNPAATAPAQPDSSDGITLELNKIEKSDKGCRAYVVVTNPTPTSYEAFKLDCRLGAEGAWPQVMAEDLKAYRRLTYLRELQATTSLPRG